MGRKVRVSIHACIRSSFLQSFYFFIHTTWGASDKTHLKAMSDEGTFERTEEMEKLIETRYTFVICFVGVFRRLVIELGDTDFLKEQFKDLVTPSGIHPFTLDGHTGYVSCLTAVGDKVYPGIVIMPSEYGMLLLMSALASCEGMLILCFVSL